MSDDDCCILFFVAWFIVVFFIISDPLKRFSELTVRFDTSGKNRGKFNFSVNFTSGNFVVLSAPVVHPLPPPGSPSLYFYFIVYLLYPHHLSDDPVVFTGQSVYCLCQSPDFLCGQSESLYCMPLYLMSDCAVSLSLCCMSVMPACVIFFFFFLWLTEIVSWCRSLPFISHTLQVPIFFFSFFSFHSLHL